MADRQTITLKEDVVARFWAKVDRRGADECWPWLGAINSSGYGSFGVNRIIFAAQQISLVIDGRARPAPPQNHALHNCDNRACVNPAHLRWGSHRENMDERTVRCIGFNKGPRRRVSKLTADQVRHVRESPETGLALAAKFGVCKQTISDIRLGRTWRGDDFATRSSLRRVDP